MRTRLGGWDQWIRVSCSNSGHEIIAPGDLDIGLEGYGSIAIGYGSCGFDLSMYSQNRRGTGEKFLGCSVEPH